MEVCTINNTRKKMLSMVISSLLSEVGFVGAEKAALEKLTEALQSVICEIGTSSRSYCELSGRTDPVVDDVVVSLVKMGMDLNGIEAHARRINRSVLPPLTQTIQPKQLNILTAGIKHPHPFHIPAHLPQFPDPHADTPTDKQPVTECEAIREKEANQRGIVERTLTRFATIENRDTHSLFLTDDPTFTLIACTPQFPAYLQALLPRGQEFDYEDEFTSPQRAHKARETGESKEDNEAGKAGESDLIDNPYLRPVKLPPKKKPKSRYPNQMQLQSLLLIKKLEICEATDTQ